MKKVGSVFLILFMLFLAAPCWSKSHKGSKAVDLDLQIEISTGEQQKINSQKEEYTLDLQNPFFIRMVLLYPVDYQLESLKEVGLEENFTSKYRQASTPGSVFASYNGKISHNNRYELQYMLSAKDYYAPCKIGPFIVSLKDPDGNIVEQEIEKVVKFKPDAKPLGAPLKKNQLCAAEIFIDQERVYVMQPFILTIRVYCQTGAVHEVLGEDIDLGDQTDFTYRKLAEKEQIQSVLIGGKQCQFIEYKYELTPLKVGKHEISPVTIHYRYDQMGIDYFNPFMAINNYRLQDGFVRSNYLSIHVNSLPGGSDTMAVGKFEDLWLEVDKTTCASGELVDWRLILKGEGNFDHIGEIKLKLPPKAKSFAGKTYMNGKNMKVFEHVVRLQGQGAVQLPIQSFTFMDTRLGQYNTIYSKPVEIVLESDQEVETSAPAVVPAPSVQEQVDSSESNQVVDEFFWLEELTRHNETTQSRHIPLPWFLLLLFLPLSLPICLQSRRMWKLVFGPKYALSWTLARMERLQEKQEFNDVFHTVVGYFEKRLSIQSAVIDDLWLEEVMLGLGFGMGDVVGFISLFHQSAGLHLGYSSLSVQAAEMLIQDMVEYIKKIDAKILAKLKERTK